MCELPSLEVILNVSKHKKQLIQLIVTDFMLHKDDFTSRIVVTGNDPVPIEINLGVLIRREDMKVTHDEADTIIINQIVFMDLSNVLVVAEDTDIFVLLCHFIFSGQISAQVKMASPFKDRAVIDMNATVHSNMQIMSDLLAAHGLTGCDTVAPYSGIGKGTALKILRSGKYTLSVIGDTRSNLTDVMQQASYFILACYGHSCCESITAARHKVWSTKLSRNTGKAPEQKSLPPTKEAFKENVTEHTCNLPSGSMLINLIIQF